MLKIGLTGGIGSGKSTIAKIFSVLGIPVWDADKHAKWIMENDPELKEKLLFYFGEAVFDGNQLQRSYLANIVFNQPEKLELLNSLVHPAAIAQAEKWMKEQTSAYVIKEAALLFESGSVSHLDYVIGVTAPRALRIQRVMLRDQISREEVVARMNRQIDDGIKMKLCNWVIQNDQQQALLPQVLKIHNKILSLTEQNG
jgi:dephospho-CoA kinase